MAASKKFNKPASSRPVPAVTAPTPAVTASTPAVTAPTPAVTASTPAVTASTPAVTAPTPAVTAPTPAVTAPTPAVTAPTPAVTAPTPAVTAPTPAVTVSTPAVTAPTPAVAAPTPATPTPATPVAAVESLLPFGVLPEVLRANAEQGIESLRAQYAAFKGNAAACSGKIEESLTAARSGARVFNGKVLDVFRANIDAGFAHLNALFNVATLSEAIKLQQDFHKQQAETLQAQAQDLADYARQVAGQVVEPVRSSIALPFQAA